MIIYHKSKYDCLLFEGDKNSGALPSIEVVPLSTAEKIWKR